MHMGVDLQGKTILITGVTGQVATPLAITLSKTATVIGAARFSNPAKRSELEQSGVSCVTIDLESGDVDEIPDGIDFVLNFAVAKTNDWDRDLDANAGGVLTLMEKVASASAFVHCSSTAVYKPMGHHVFSEEGPYGDNHGVWEFLRTYSTSKIATETAVRWAAERHGLPTTIARLSVPYGDNGGWPAIHLEMLINGSKIPVHTDDPSTYHPIHEDDIASMIPGLLGAASVPVTTVNWGGTDPVSVEEWCSYLGDLTGLSVGFEKTDATIDSVMVDLSRLHHLVGETSVHWRDGMRRMVEARHPELLG
jgi:nucleoside-diphosphate-sugar epimerase